MRVQKCFISCASASVSNLTKSTRLEVSVRERRGMWSSPEETVFADRCVCDHWSSPSLYSKTCVTCVKAHKDNYLKEKNDKGRIRGDVEVERKWMKGWRLRTAERMWGVKQRWKTRKVHARQKKQSYHQKSIGEIKLGVFF